MIHPTLDEFRALAKPGALVPVYRDIVADLETPVSAYMKIARTRTYPYLLESVEKADTIGRYSFIGADPSVVFKASGRSVSITRDGKTETHESDKPIEDLRAIMKGYHPVEVAGLPEFHGGAVGYMSYDYVRFFETLPDNNPDPLGLPDLYYIITDTIVIFDHVNNRMKVVSNAHLPDGATASDAEAAYAAATEKINDLVTVLREPLTPAEVQAPVHGGDATVTSSFTEGDFCKAVDAAKEYVKAGDAFQIVLSQRFERPVSASPVTLYRALRCINPSPYMTLFEFPEFSLVGASPEVMTQVRGRRVMVRPIAGTRPRGATTAEDVAHEKDLMADEKELAEHVMLVDLGRNDIGRVSDIGTVSPCRLMTIEKYSHVMHIVSEVEGVLREDCDAFDALQATFPMGTVSGAPKIRAMQIIDELEPIRRGPYAGGCGYIAFNGDMDTCIIIRTMIVKDGMCYVQSGAGLVYDSVPEREFEETVNKARACMRAVEFAERGLEA